MQAKQSELKEYSRNTLDDLFGNHKEEISTSVLTLPIPQIVLSPSQPRRYFDSDKLQSLANSIKEVGLLEPIVVRKIGDEKYELIAGERRLKACEKAGLDCIAVSIISVDDTTASHIRLVENLQREDLNVYEETMGILELLAILLNTDTEDVVSILHRMLDEDKGKVPHNVMGNLESRTIQELFLKLGKITWQSFISNRLPILKLQEDIKEILLEGKLEYTKAIAISKIKDKEKRVEVLEQAISNKLSLSRIKELVEKILEERGESKVKDKTMSTKEITTRLSKISSFKKNKSALEKIFQDTRKSNELDKLTKKILDLLESVEQQDSIEAETEIA
jgi:ParB family transcriptional regulator, chromosome partitioning protein